MRKRDVHVGGTQLPMFVPESDWQPPAELPDLAGLDVALDSECKDDGLAHGRGPGWPYRSGHVAGVSAAWREGGQLRSTYVPISHPDTECRDPSVLADWLRRTLETARSVAFHGEQYDAGWWLADLGVPVPSSERMNDTVAAAVMLDENRRSYRLDDVARWRGVPGKDEGLLREAAAAHGYQGDDVKANMWRLPARFVGPYAAADAEATLLSWETMLPDLQSQDLLPAYRLEVDLIPLVIEMRRRGVRVDVARAEASAAGLILRRDEIVSELSRRLSRRLDARHLSSPRHLEEMFLQEQIPFPRTAKTGQGSFKSEWMSTHEHWLPSLVARASRLEDCAEKFLRTYLCGYAHVGRLHANVNLFRNEEGGTRSHRISYSDPPLQQMPSRDEELAPLVRGCFLPEEGERWAAVDASQQELRLIVHYSVLLGLRRAAEVAELYRADPRTDFHEVVMDWTGLERKPAKNASFAKSYGAGLPKFALMIGRDLDEAREVMERYDEQLPFVRDCASYCDRLAQRRGHVRLIDGARSRFDAWEPASREDRGGAPLPLDRARAAWPNVRLVRANTRKAFNRLIQGSAARQVKLAMRACWREGVVPLIQMHDELDLSVSSERQGARAAELMRDAVQLEVPMQVDVEYGRDWGDAKHSWEEASSG